MYRLAAVAFGLVVWAGCASPVAAPDSATVAGKDGNDAGAAVGAQGLDAGGAPTGPKVIVTVDGGFALPPAYQAQSASFLATDGSGNDGTNSALNVLNQRVLLNETVTANQNPCPLPYTSSSGQVFCDGFNAVDSSSFTAVVDTNDFRSGLSGCTIPTQGGTFNGIYGIWTDHPDASGNNFYVLSPTTCADLGLGTPYVSTKSAGTSTDIANLNAAFVAGTQVTVGGVVVAVWSAKTSFGFVMQDPQGGPHSGLFVYKSASSTANATAPNVGDYVKVTGTTAGTSVGTQELKL